MNSARPLSPLRQAWVIFLAAALAPALAVADEPRIHFQKPSFQKPGNNPAPAATTSGRLEFRSSSASTQNSAPAAAAEPLVQRGTDAANEQRVARSAQLPVAKPLRPASAAIESAAPSTTHRAARPTFAQPSSGAAMLADYRSDADNDASVVAIGHNQPWITQRANKASVVPAGFSLCTSGCTDGCCEPACGCEEPACGVCEPECGLAEPGCGIVEPGCGLEPDCGLVEPGCGLEPACGCCEPDCGLVDCGNCVGRPGPDYWCFPVCLPRFKDFIVWGGVHGFKGPRDHDDFGGSGDGNFGFQEGFNLGGRMPLVGLILPQISYQLGYQAAQSQLSGTSGDSTDDRTQHFVTAGLFRRVPAGLQFGVVWDLLNDDQFAEEDFHQLRYEISVKGKLGCEFGFWGATHTNSNTVFIPTAASSFTFQSVDQYCGFLRYQFREGGQARIWGGGTDENEGIVGADFHVPLNNRWSLQSGFNYLITDLAAGTDAAREESWNVGMNLCWHFGKTAKAFRANPHRPLFDTADNGWMFIDQKP